MRIIRLPAASLKKRLTRGVVALEMAVAAPVMLLLMLGAADLALWIRTVFRLDELTTQIAQIVTQCPALNDPADFKVLFADAQKISSTVDITSSSGGAFIVTAMGISNNIPIVLWQRRTGNPQFNSRFGSVNTNPVTGAYTIVTGEVLVGTEAFSAVQPWSLARMLMRGSPLSPQVYSQSMFLVRSSNPSQLSILGSGSQPACFP